MKRVMICSVIVICALAIWGFFAHTAWSQVDVITAILGRGVAGFIPEFTDQNKIGDSVIFQDASGAVGIGTTSPNAKLFVNQTGNATGTNSEVSGVSAVAAGDASGDNSEVHAAFVRAIGNATNTTPGVGSEVVGLRALVDGTATGPDSDVTAIVGRANATSGSAQGVRGVSESTDGIGVRGRADATSGGATGVFGSTRSPDGQGVRGLNRAQSGSGFGVLGQSLSTSGFPIGVLGQTPNAAEGVGVLGLSSSTSGGTGVLGRGPFRGVVGQAQATSGSTIAVEGENFSPDGSAIFGRGNATSGPSQGVVGQSLSSSGIGVHGISPGVAGQFDGKVQINCPTFPCVTINGLGFLDMAENLPLAAHVAPGDVIVVAEGKGGYGIAPASLPYDTRVAGIVSEHSPILLQSRQREEAAPVAMVGVVRAKATAANGPIHVGDLLTTSGIPGHLMRCPTALRCIGAVVGKALEPLAKGEKQILVMLWRQ